MRQEAPQITETFIERESFGDLLSRLATASAGLVRDELELAKQEFREKAKSLRAANPFLTSWEGWRTKSATRWVGRDTSPDTFTPPLAWRLERVCWPPCF